MLHLASPAETTGLSSFSLSRHRLQRSSRRRPGSLPPLGGHLWSKVHRRIYQHLPHHRLGEFRPDAPGHFKDRRLETVNERLLVFYALDSETGQYLGPTLAGFDTLEMADALAQTYSRLDFLHPFRKGNSRTLRIFTEQLARDNTTGTGLTGPPPTSPPRRATISMSRATWRPSACAIPALRLKR